MFAGRHDPVARAAVVSPSARPSTIEPVVIWGVLAVERALPPDVVRRPPLEVQTLAADLLTHHGWDPVLSSLVGGAQTSSVSCFALDAADPDRLAPWPASRVTALGDAVHAMPPTGGQGAATAILDAYDLAEALAEVADGEKTVVVGVHDYETRMRERGARAVRESLQPVRWIQRAATPAGGLAFRAAAGLVTGGRAMLVRTSGRSRG